MKTRDHVRSRLTFALAPITVASALVVACGALTGDRIKDATKTALDAADMACIFNDTLSLTTSEEVRAACKIARELAPLVDRLFMQREGARKTGVYWTAETDGGIDAVDTMREGP